MNKGLEALKGINTIINEAIKKDLLTLKGSIKLIGYSSIIKQDLEELSKLKTLVKNNCIGFTLEQVVEKGLYQIYLEQMCDIMCSESEEEYYE